MARSLSLACRVSAAQWKEWIEAGETIDDAPAHIQERIAELMAPTLTASISIADICLPGFANRAYSIAIPLGHFDSAKSLRDATIGNLDNVNIDGTDNCDPEDLFSRNMRRSTRPPRRTSTTTRFHTSTDGGRKS